MLRVEVMEVLRVVINQIQRLYLSIPSSFLDNGDVVLKYFKGQDFDIDIRLN